jgi:hypothetical protein
MQLIPVDRRTLRQAYFRSRHLRMPLNWFRYTGIGASDLFIASYPRSGTTWLRFLLFELLTGEASEFVSVNKRIPYVGKHRGAPKLLPNGGRVIQTHEVFRRAVGSAIYLVRDPRSVVLSEYLWQLRTGLSRETFDSFFHAFLGGKANPYGRWDQHVNKWVKSDLGSTNRLHVVRFEDLRADTSGELARIVDFLDLRLDGSVIERVIANNSLAQMRAKEERAPGWALGARARPDIRFVNAGSINRWKQELSRTQMQQIGDEFGETLESTGYQVFPMVPRMSGSSEKIVSPAGQEMPSGEKRVKVLFVAGWGRSGSTLLDNLLGQIDGFFSTGEIRYIWERGVLGEWTCGCGRPVKECEVWSAVLAKIREEEPAPDAQTVVDWQKQVTRFRHTMSLLRLGSHDVRDGSMVQSYVSLVGKLFSAVAEVTGARVIVDSSKRPSDAAILELVPNIELHVVQLVRDPRAVAYSWGKRQPGIDRHGVVESTAGWLAWNVASEAVRRKISGRSMLVRYEDFVKNPTATLRSIAELVSEDPESIPLMQNGTFEVGGNHTVSGNPARFRMGSVEVSQDIHWIERLRPTQKATATLIALPLLHRYRYLVWTPAESAPASDTGPRSGLVR